MPPPTSTNFYINLFFQIHIKVNLTWQLKDNHFIFESKWQLWARGGVQPGQIDRVSQHTETNNHSLSHSHLQKNLESSINLTPICMSLDCGRKPEYPETTHTDTWRTCKLTRKSTWNWKQELFLFLICHRMKRSQTGPSWFPCCSCCLLQVLMLFKTCFAIDAVSLTVNIDLMLQQSLMLVWLLLIRACSSSCSRCSSKQSWCCWTSRGSWTTCAA